MSGYQLTNECQLCEQGVLRVDGYKTIPWFDYQNVYVKNVPHLKCASCGEVEYDVDDVYLEQEVRIAIAQRNGRLTGLEARVFRSHLKWTLDEAATQLETSPDELAEWEKDYAPLVEGVLEDVESRLRIALLKREGVTDPPKFNLNGPRQNIYVDGFADVQQAQIRYQEG